MSRNLVILLVVLTAGIAGLIVFSKLRSPQEARVAADQQGEPTTHLGTKPTSSGNAANVPLLVTNSQGRTTMAAPAAATITATQQARTTPPTSVPATILTARRPMIRRSSN